jgi:hypothetical protein
MHNKDLRPEIMKLILRQARISSDELLKNI